ncbi:PQQ-dependent sugar dehydrogenase [Candidatus Amesbacteria bacterium]|nr:PQQ-dependent sugar dehydrogenase [Candidatus Amesbacteria bacterium]
MKRLILVIFVTLGILAFNFRWRGLKPTLLSPVPQPPKAATSSNSTGLPLSLPPGFNIEIFASGLGNPRDLEWQEDKLLVSIPGRGEVYSVTDKKTLISGLNKPHGLAYYPGRLYVAETDKLTLDGKKILDLPTGGNHTTRSILIKDNQIYVSIGSTCNVCSESDPRRAAIWVAHLDGSDFQPFATGLRNSVFLTRNSKTNQIWATEMGRDWLGNNLPPDEINILKEDQNYGWPACFGQNILDTDFAPQGRCNATFPSFIDLPAHSAPLGLAFIPDSWPPEYRSKLLVAYHGSWNRHPPTGYKIVLIDPETKQISDFLSGWLQSDNTALGRPVDLIFDFAGNLYVSDDQRGVVYKITPPAPTP